MKHYSQAAVERTFHLQTIGKSCVTYISAQILLTRGWHKCILSPHYYFMFLPCASSLTKALMICSPRVYTTLSSWLGLNLGA
jgi:hypothetical protein